MQKKNRARDIKTGRSDIQALKKKKKLGRTTGEGVPHEKGRGFIVREQQKEGKGNIKSNWGLGKGNGPYKLETCQKEKKKGGE